ncbi:uncharacterized protein L201_006090 [Kwoniella dendrophila CBS 6074]|uniref:C2H2-type domain-containing protein n=1 Tax=Kwoniella dendrophila CBS 6074 TaxID=1295534 RepID=A0AAX4K216_9TREE
MTTGGSNNSSPTDFAFEAPINSNTNISAPFKPEPVKTADSFTSNGSENSPFTPSGGQINNFPASYSYNASSAASSFSSASGSGAGSSFSSVDALPAISRDFVRPSLSETRRPATAGGALQSRSPFAGYMPPNGSDDDHKFKKPTHIRPTSSDGKMRLGTTMEEGEGFFTNPFQASDKDAVESGTKQSATQTTPTVDPHYIPANRRASEPQFNVQQSWGQQSPLTASNDNSSIGLTSAHTGYLQQQQMQGSQPAHQLSAYPRANYSSRPQTSDGLPSYPHFAANVSLPSAQSIARQIPGIQAATGGFYHPPTPSSARTFDHQQENKSGYMPFRDDRSNSLNSLPPPMVGPPATGFPGDRAYSIDSGMARQGQQPPIRSSYMSSGKPGEMSSELTFVQLGGPAPKKRPRRRYDEIERLYSCGWNGCEKSYGTLNHLNAHVAMQKHGEKRLPSEFKDMRKAWRKKKRELAANNANAMYAANAAAWSQRASISSASGTESDWDRRDSMMSTASDYTHRSSASYPIGYAPWSSNGAAGGESRPSTSSSSISSVDGRSYFAAPPPQLANQPNYGNTINPNQNAYVNAINQRRVSAPQHLPMPMSSGVVGNGLDGFRQIGVENGDHPTPTAQNPFPGQGGQRAGFPFATLTSPMAGGQPMPLTGSNGGNGAYAGGGQFAFQR